MSFALGILHRLQTKDLDSLRLRGSQAQSAAQKLNAKLLKEHDELLRKIAALEKGEHHEPTEKASAGAAHSASGVSPRCGVLQCR